MVHSRWKALLGWILALAPLATLLALWTRSALLRAVLPERSLPYAALVCALAGAAAGLLYRGAARRVPRGLLELALWAPWALAMAEQLRLARTFMRQYIDWGAGSAGPFTVLQARAELTILANVGLAVAAVSLGLGSLRWPLEAAPWSPWRRRARAGAATCAASIPLGVALARALRAAEAWSDDGAPADLARVLDAAVPTIALALLALLVVSLGSLAWSLRPGMRRRDLAAGVAALLAGPLLLAPLWLADAAIAGVQGPPQRGLGGFEAVFMPWPSFGVMGGRPGGEVEASEALVLGRGGALAWAGGLGRRPLPRAPLEQTLRAYRRAQADFARERRERRSSDPAFEAASAPSERLLAVALDARLEPRDLRALLAVAARAGVRNLELVGRCASWRAAPRSAWAHRIFPSSEHFGDCSVGVMVTLAPPLDPRCEGVEGAVARASLGALPATHFRGPEAFLDVTLSEGGADLLRDVWHAARARRSADALECPSQGERWPSRSRAVWLGRRGGPQLWLDLGPDATVTALYATAAWSRRGEPAHLVVLTGAPR